MSEPFMTVAQAALQLRLHPKTVLRLIHEKRLRGTRIGKSYRILPSDLAAFGGGSDRPDSAGGLIRVSSAIDIPDLAVGEAERLASMLNALLMGGQTRSVPMHMSTIYDPPLRRLKIVLIGSPTEVADVLKVLDAVAGATR